MTNKEFVRLYNSFLGEGLDNPDQLVSHTFSGDELKEFLEHVLEASENKVSELVELLGVNLN